MTYKLFGGRADDSVEPADDNNHQNALVPHSTSETAIAAVALVLCAPISERLSATCQNGFPGGAP
jgi:hypothetical protein